MLTFPLCFSVMRTEQTTLREDNTGDKEYSDKHDRRLYFLKQHGAKVVSQKTCGAHRGWSR